MKPTTGTETARAGTAAASDRVNRLARLEQAFKTFMDIEDPLVNLRGGIDAMVSIGRDDDASAGAVNFVALRVRHEFERINAAYYRAWSFIGADDLPTPGGAAS